MPKKWYAILWILILLALAGYFYTNNNKPTTEQPTRNSICPSVALDCPDRLYWNSLFTMEDKP